MADGPEVERLEVPSRAAGERLDRYLAAQFPTLSRTRLAQLIEQGRVRVGGACAKRSHRVAAGEVVEVAVVPREPLRAEPVEFPLEILHEDADVVVVNKPSGMVVHPGAGTQPGGTTLTGALLHRYGKLSEEGGAVRPGIVHRLDKGTSGTIVVARNDAAHRGLAEQFAERTVEKIYIALVHGKLKGADGTIRLPVARDMHRRTRMTTRRRPEESRASQTDWRALATLGPFTLVEARLRTGRTHQIRVHFSALGHPVVGDALYGAPKSPEVAGKLLPELNRIFLHAARLAFVHPRTGRRVEARAPLPAELRSFLAALAEAGKVPPARVDAALQDYL
ncbi:MAG TPA: RluA family pseudouridine synthase [Candidatus Acidoferrales bacterium]|nr:RluA family pseudouridine synthase [Candidatus Acidoferrales bacterium]